MTHAPSHRWPAHGWAGLGLVAVFWALNWSLPGLRSHWAFFPLWLGFCLTVDALTVARKGDSLLTRNPRAWAGLFVVSAPAWWLFELLNRRLGNWEYLGRDQFSDLEYFLYATLSFSTVIPAVFGAAELMGTFGWLRRLRRGPRVAPGRGMAIGFFATGAAWLALLLAWPRFFFPLVWGALYLMVEATNMARGRRTLLDETARGDWRAIAALGAGALTCGAFWEMWNFYSYPKWIYHVPFVDFWHVFEMPALGYLGYIPFSWELFALYCLVAPAGARSRGKIWLHFGRREE